MADTNTPQPVEDGDLSPPTSTSFASSQTPQATGVGVGASDESDKDRSATGTGRVTEARQAIGSGATSLQQQATDKIRLFAEDGKERAGGALEQFAQMLIDAAGQVDEKLGAQYGDYARTAATSVQGLASSVRDKDVDELAADVRGYIAKSPAAAVGVTAALGFALARMVHAGLDQRH